MGNVYEAFSLGDRTMTGKVIGDFTIDFCKTMAGAAVSQAGMTLTELGVGKYVLMNPNITERTIISGYLTADSTKSFSLLMDPVDGDIAKDSTLATLLGSGNTAVDHDTGGEDNLRFATLAGVGVDNASIVAYLKADYDAGNMGPSYVKGNSITDVNGRWARPIYLDSGNTYTIVAYKQGEYVAAATEITI